MQRSSKKVHLALLSYKLRCYTRIHSPEKSRDNTREKIRYFLTCVWYCQSAADTSLPFRATSSQSKVVFRNFFGLWLLNTEKSVSLTYRQVTFKLNLKGEKTKIWKKKTKSYVFSGFGNGISSGWERKSTTRRFAISWFWQCTWKISSLGKDQCNKWQLCLLKIRPIAWFYS